MDIKKEQEEAYYKSIHDDLKKEIKQSEYRIKNEWELSPEQPKPTKEQLRAIRLSKLEKPKPLS